jgi:hypothetical protein
MVTNQGSTTFPGHLCPEFYKRAIDALFHFFETTHYTVGAASSQFDFALLDLFPNDKALILPEAKLSVMNLVAREVKPTSSRFSCVCDLSPGTLKTYIETLEEKFIGGSGF